MATDQRIQYDLFSVENEVASAVERSPVPKAAPHVSTPLAPSPVVEPVTRPVVDPAPILAEGMGDRVVSDAGAELTYNRRNRIKTAKSWSDISHLNDALKVKEAVKSNIWPKIDYQKLIDDGMEPLVAHIVKQVYDSVAAKPNTTVLNDAAFERYIDSLNRVENGLMEWANDKEAVSKWMQRVTTGYGTRVDPAAGVSKSLLEHVFPDGWRAHESELRIGGANKLLGALQPGYEDARKGLKALKEGWPRKRESWEVQGFRVLEKPKVDIIPSSSVQRHQGYFMAIAGKYVKSFESLEQAEAEKNALKPFVLFGKNGFLKDFETNDAAVESAKEFSKRERKNGISDKGVLVESVEREGIARRMPGEDISSERLMTEFGLKGVNFGNWMKTPSARAEAQLHLNHAFDSFHDLADIMGVPPKALSLNGMLGLAIGAQGAGGTAAAHFVPGVNEINLTRKNGAGSLAHEWAHALDHYFAVQAGLATKSTPFLTEHASANLTVKAGQMVYAKYLTTEVPHFGGLRPEIALAFNAIVDSMNKRPESEEEFEARKKAIVEKTQNGINGWLKAIRKQFTGQEEAFDVLANKVRSGDLGDGKVSISNTIHLSPVLVDMRNLYKSAHGRLYPPGEMQSLQAWVDRAEYLKEKAENGVEAVAGLSTKTQFAIDAAQLDEDKGGKPYWSTNLEKFARAFDAYISDSLEERLVKNQYLSHVGRSGQTVPQGVDRAVINKAFQTLVDTIEVKEQGAVLFSNGRSDDAHGRISLPEIHKEINRLKKQWPNMPKVSVVMDVKDLPFASPEQTDGAYCDGHVYVVANNIADLKQLQKVMAHECVLHHSMEEMLGDYGFSKLHHGLQKLKRDGDPTVCALAANILSRYGELPPEIETKEIVARAGEMCLDEKGNVKVAFGFMKSVFAGIAGWLRDHGISVPFTNAELQGIMHGAGEWIKKDSPAQQRADSGLAFNSFAGIRAETAPLETLRVAREMYVDGEDDRVIWKTTGWTFGFADAKPRFEISDDQANVVVENRTAREIWKDMEGQDRLVQNIGQFIAKYPDHPLTAEINQPHGARAKYAGMRLDDPAAAREIEKYLEHQKLYEAYPSLAKINAGEFTDVFKSDDNEFGTACFVPSLNMMKFSGIRNAEAFKSVALHELQHAIQEIEGFSPGGSPGDFKNLDLSNVRQSEIRNELQSIYDTNPEFYGNVLRANQLQNAVVEKYGPINRMQYDESDPLVQEWWDTIDKRDSFPESKEWSALSRDLRAIERNPVVISPVDQYKRLAGEAEAALTQVRADMSPTERAQEYPLDNLVIPIKSQVQKCASHVPPLVADGFFSGKVLDVVDGVATQRINRGGDVVRHAVSVLSKVPVIGDVVDIGYKDGIGIVSGKGVGVDRER